MTRDATSSSIIDKSVDVLDLLALAEIGLSLADVVASTGHNKSTVHRVLMILVGKELAQFDERSRTYALGPRMARWAQAAWQKTDLTQITDEDLAELSEQTDMNIALSVLSGHLLTFIRTSVRHRYKLAPRVGGQSDLHCTAAGKIALAAMNRSELDTYFASADLDKYTERTITEEDTLRRELRLVRERGYAIADREELWRVLGLAVPVRDHDGGFIAALSAWTPRKTASIEELHALSEYLCSVGDEFSARFGLPNRAPTLRNLAAERG